LLSFYAFARRRGRFASAADRDAKAGANGPFVPFTIVVEYAKEMPFG
jgi:hypothetical protein